MGATFLGDIPSGSEEVVQITHASVASNGAASVFGGTSSSAAFWRAPSKGVITFANWEPIGAAAAGTSTASFRKVSLIDQGQAGAGTVHLADLSLTASIASFTPTAMTLATASATATTFGTVTQSGIGTTNVTVAANDVICVSQAATGTDATDTVLVAGQVTFGFRAI